MSVKETIIKLGYSSEKGRVREINEDSLYWVESLDDKARQVMGRLYIVADGMGGYSAGEIASKIAVDTIAQHYQYGFKQNIPSTLIQAIQVANDEIYQQAQTQQMNMGTTVLCAVIRGNDLYLAYIGDSRGYLLRSNKIFKLTEDHTLVNELLKNGAITSQEAEFHPQRHVLSRALGKRPEVNPDIVGPVKVQPGDVILLCTDGIWSYIEESQIEYSLLTNINDPQMAAESLTQFADVTGGNDNATAIVLKMEKVVPVINT